MMYGLSLTQPWAQLMALGHKTIETRGRMPARYRIGDTIVIQASRNFPRVYRELCEIQPFYRLIHDAGYWGGTGGIGNPEYHFAELPLGVAVAVGRLTAAARVIDAAQSSPPQVDWFPSPMTVEYALGNYEPNRWMWRFEDIRPLRRPVPLIGHQYIWLLSETEESAVLAELAA